MAGDAIHGHVCAPIGDQISVQIMVMIPARISAHTAAHTAVINMHFSDTCHAARHDVNDPS
jgi:hypothetical protein